MAELKTELKSVLANEGLTVTESDGALEGARETITAKWWLGGRKVTYKTAIRLAGTEHTAHFREVAVERSWGIPPPTLTVETTTTSGWTRSGTRTDVSAPGGGKLDYARVREAVEKAVVAAGWTFHLEGGRLP